MQVRVEVHVARKLLRRLEWIRLFELLAKQRLHNGLRRQIVAEVARHRDADVVQHGEVVARRRDVARAAAGVGIEEDVVRIDERDDETERGRRALQEIERAGAPRLLPVVRDAGHETVVVVPLAAADGRAGAEEVAGVGRIPLLHPIVRLQRRDVLLAPVIPTVGGE